jgi:hypothetical protein
MFWSTVVLAAAAVLGTSCTPPTTSERTWQEVCAPSGSGQYQLVLTPLVVPAGASLSSTFRIAFGTTGDVGYDDPQVQEVDLSNLVVNQPSPVGDADAGKCVHLRWSAGLHFTVLAVPLLPPVWVTAGWPPGWDGTYP